MQPIPRLAGRVGRYREQAPLPALRPHFRCVWTNAIPATYAGPVAVVPDGCVDLVWRDGRLVVAGPDVTAARPAVRPGTSILGVRFRAGAAASWLRLPMSEIVGCQIDLAELWGRPADDFCQMLGEIGSIGAQSAVLQRALVGVLPSVAPPLPDAAAIFGLMQAGSGPAGGKILALRDRLDISERTLRRRSHDYFGYGLKTLDRILRFQCFLALARGQNEVGLAGLAIDAGYADQAHLSREIQALCGMTARDLVRQIAPPRDGP